MGDGNKAQGLNTSQVACVLGGGGQVDTQDVNLIIDN